MRLVQAMINLERERSERKEKERPATSTFISIEESAQEMLRQFDEMTRGKDYTAPPVHKREGFAPSLSQILTRHIHDYPLYTPSIELRRDEPWS